MVYLTCLHEPSKVIKNCGKGQGKDTRTATAW